MIYWFWFSNIERMFLDFDMTYLNLDKVKYRKEKFTENKNQISVMLDPLHHNRNNKQNTQQMPIINNLVLSSL